jgi:hypothetical protein
MYGGKETAYMVLVWKCVGKRQLETPRCRWGYTVTMNVKEARLEGVNCINLAQTRECGMVLRV